MSSFAAYWARHIMDRYVTAKLEEWDGYRTAVDNWELKQYLTIF